MSQGTATIPSTRISEYPLIYVLLAACLGGVLDRRVGLSPLLWGVGLTVMLALWRLTWRQWPRAGVLFVLGSVSALAGLWHHDRWSLFPADEIGRYAGEEPLPVCVRVVALEPPRWSPAEQPTALSTLVQGEMSRLVVRVVALRQAAEWQPASGRVLLLMDGCLSGVMRGDTLEVAGQLVRVRAPANPGELDLAAMGRRSRQLATLRCGHPECVKRLSQGTAWSALRQLHRLRVWAERTLDRYVAAPQSALAAALLLGSRERLDRGTVEEFFVSGTVHLLSISGSHVAILASIMWVVIRLDWFPRRRMLLLTCVLAVAYALLTGAQPPVVRATILIVVYCLARWTHRQSVAWNSLAAAGLVTLGLSPDGMFDIGTQLSYLAVAILVAQRRAVDTPPAADSVRRLVEQSRPGWWRAARGGLRGAGQLVAASTRIWLLSIPCVANRFHLVPLLGVPANLLLWLPIPIALFSGLAVLVLAPVPPLASLCGWVCQQSLALTQWLMAVCAAPAWGHVWVAGPPMWLVLLFYAGLAAYQFSVFRLPTRWWMTLLAVWVTANLFASATAARVHRMVWPQSLRCSCIAVGHGVSVLAELPDGRAILYDAGRMGSSQAAALPICSVLWSRRVAHLDAIVLSHADADHFNAVPELLDRFSVGVVLVSPVMFDADTAALTALRTAIVAPGVPLECLHEGLRASASAGVDLTVLHPPVAGCRGGDNGNSIVLRMSHGCRSLLLLGDLEGVGLDELLAEAPTNCDMLLSPHHGSQRSRPLDVIRWAGPLSVVISEGAVADPRRLLLDGESPDVRVWWTHRDGMVEVVTDGRAFEVRAWRHVAPDGGRYSVRDSSW